MNSKGLVICTTCHRVDDLDRIMDQHYGFPRINMPEINFDRGRKRIKCSGGWVSLNEYIREKKEAIKRNVSHSTSFSTKRKL